MLEAERDPAQRQGAGTAGEKTREWYGLYSFIGRHYEQE
jgi:hypothetical protein